ncbi:MAG: HD domain-containing phosphohydrolase [Pseudomonadota bacterium]
MVDEKRQLEALNAQQNEELRTLNDSLEAKVESRTREVEAAREKIAVAHSALQAGFSATIEIFARLIQSRSGLASQSNVAADCQAVANAMNLDKQACGALHQAALLCDIGKLSLPDEVVAVAFVDLDAPAQREYCRHPLVAEATLISLDQLSAAAKIIRAHCERLDGSGFPDKLKGEAIPLTARILGVVKAYADLLEGRWFSERHTVSEAREFMVENAGVLFDAEVVHHFSAWLNTRQRRNEERGERKVSLGSLKAGMKVSRDLHDGSGCLILAEGLNISDRLIDRLEALQKSLGQSFTVHVEEHL